jgi:hypothetical protein
MRIMGLALSAICLAAVAVGGCNSAPYQPPGQTPTAASAPGSIAADAPNNSMDAFSIKLIGEPGAP